MIPILYGNKETSFNHNGIGLLTDAIVCEVTEERNGIYELELSYPITGQHYQEIDEDYIIKALPNETSEPQLFRIYKSTKPINGIVTYYAEHISYELNGNPTGGLVVNGNTALVAITNALNNAAIPHNFRAWSDISTLADISITAPCSVRALLGGAEGSILETYGGEFEFDNFNIKLHASRGSDTDIVIEYGKNLTDIKQEKNISEVYTAIYPYAKYTPETEGDEEPEEQIITLPEQIITLDSAVNYGYVKALIIDLSKIFSEEDSYTVATLRTKATEYLSNNIIDSPSVSITASFIQLWQTKDYENIAPLERVSLCDSVTVRFSKLGISVKAKVVKTIFDTIREKYKSVEIGDIKNDFSATVKKQQAEMAKVTAEIKRQSSAAQIRLEKAIQNATELITGQKGGYVVLNPAEKPQEILIMNTPSIDTATSVWRWNSAGLGYSSTGYSGEYGLAMTMDGAIVADYITSGTLDGALIRAGTVSAEAISQAFKTIISDEINGNILTAKTVIEQEFTAADSELLSKITLLESGVATAQTIIQQNTAAIALKASQMDVNYLGERVATAESAITVNADAINSKVSSTTFNALQNRVSWAESDIEQNSESIQMKVSKKMSFDAATRSSAYPTSTNTTSEQKKGLYFCTSNEKYYYWNEIDLTWVITANESIYSAFVQTASGFKFSGNVAIDGSLITSGTVSADRVKVYRIENLDGGGYLTVGGINKDLEYYYGGNLRFKIYTDGATATNMWLNSANILGHNTVGNKTYPKGIWDFANCTPQNLNVIAKFG